MELEVIKDLKILIIEYYEDLKNERELSQTLKRMMVYYEEIIEEK